MASPRATARAGRPPSLIKFRVHAARALASLTRREFNRSQVSAAPDFEGFYINEYYNTVFNVD